MKVSVANGHRSALVRVKISWTFLTIDKIISDCVDFHVLLGDSPKFLAESGHVT